MAARRSPQVALEVEDDHVNGMQRGLRCNSDEPRRSRKLEASGRDVGGGAFVVAGMRSRRRRSFTACVDFLVNTSDD